MNKLLECAINYCGGAAVGVMVAILSTNACAQSKPALTRDIDAPGAQPFVLTCQNNDPSSPGCFTNFVPAGKRMVVEMITTNVFGDNLNGSVTQTLRAVRFQQAGTSSTEGIFDLIIPTPNVGLVNSYYPTYTGTQFVKLYLDEGKRLYGYTEVTRTGASEGSLEIYAIGFLVDK